MTATIETIITCDGLTCQSDRAYADGDQKMDSASMQRANFSWGWRFINGKDYCPECVAKLPLDSLGRIKVQRRKSGSLTKKQLRKAGTLIAASHVWQQDIYGEASEEACVATRQIGLDLAQRYKLADRLGDLTICEEIERMVKEGEI